MGQPTTSIRKANRVRLVNSNGRKYIQSLLADFITHPDFVSVGYAYENLLFPVAPTEIVQAAAVGGAASNSVQVIRNGEVILLLNVAEDYDNASTVQDFMLRLMGLFNGYTYSSLVE